MLKGIPSRARCYDVVVDCRKVSLRAPSETLKSEKPPKSFLLPNISDAVLLLHEYWIGAPTFFRRSFVREQEIVKIALHSTNVGSRSLKDVVIDEPFKAWLIYSL